MPCFEVEEVAVYRVYAPTKEEAKMSVAAGDAERTSVHVTAQLTGECEPNCECEICL